MNATTYSTSDRGNEANIVRELCRRMHAAKSAAYLLFEGRAVASVQEIRYVGGRLELAVSVNTFCPPRIYRALNAFFFQQPIVCDYI